MTNSKTSRLIAPKQSTTNVLSVPEEKGKSRERLMAELSFSPAITNSITSANFVKGSFGALDLAESVGVMKEKIAKVKVGDLSDLEATLIAQASTLDTVFNELASRAALNIGAHVGAVDTYLRLAFKAQAQCRATLEALAAMKNPKPSTFVRQQNVAYQQQVNNGGERATDADSGVTPRPNRSNQTNELLDGNHG